MRGWFVYVTTIILLTVLACLFVWIFEPSIFSESFSFFSPIPSQFALPVNAQVATLDIWTLPKVIVNTHDAKAPVVSARSVLVVDVATNTILFAKNAQDQLPMASLTKIMTAIVALEHPKNPDIYGVRSAALVGEDSMGLSSGEALTLSDLLYGLVLHSGNDAAEVLADNFPTGREGFIEAMNEKVFTLGLSNTHFTNPTGLQGDGNQYATAADLAVMTKYALFHFPLFRTVAKTFDYVIPATNTHKAYYLENETNLLTSYPGVEGVKTGYTPEAGLCLVTYLEYGGQKIIGVILGSDDRRDDMKELLDYSLKKVGVVPPQHG